jgi:hypothetical protein
MSSEDEKKMIKLEEKMEQLTRVNMDLILAIKGNPEMGNHGMAQRMELLESDRKTYTMELQATQQFVFKQLDDIEARMDSKFEKLAEKIDSKFVGIETFKKDVNEFKTLVNIITSKKSWSFIFKIAGLLIIVGAAFVAWYKGGYELVERLIKLIIK